MDRWLAASDIVGLPGLPGTRRGLSKAAVRAGWTSRRRSGRGGGLEYLVADLPAAARLELARREAEQYSHSLPARLTSIDTAAAADGRAAARAAILAAFGAFAAAALLPVSAAAAPFALLYSRGETAVPDWARQIVGPALSAGTLLRWRRAANREGLSGLTVKWGRHRKGTGWFGQNPGAEVFLSAMLAHQPHRDAAQMLADLTPNAEIYGSLPSLRTVERWLAAWKAENANTLMAMTNPDQHRSLRLAAFGSASAGITRANQLWEMDSTIADIRTRPKIEFQTGDGKRYALLVVIDVATRRIKALLSETSKALEVTALLRMAILDWGMFETLKTDNGKDYTSNHVTTSVLALTGAVDAHQLCPPHQPQLKPHVERVIRTISHQLLEILPGYTGHSVADAQAIRNRQSFAERMRRGTRVVETLLSPAELQDRINRWITDVYERQPHRGLGGKSPFEVASMLPGTVRAVDERALDLLLSPLAGLRTVGKKGIAVDGQTFIAPELGALIGDRHRRVEVRRDMVDFGAIYVFNPSDHTLICKAFDAEREGLNVAEIATRAKEKQRKHVAEAMAELKRAKRMFKPLAVADEMLAKAAEAAGKVAPFPKRTEPVATPAVRAATPPPPAPIEIIDARAEIAARNRTIAARTSRPAAGKPDARALWRRWVWVREGLDAGMAIDAQDRAWADAYARTPDWRAMAKLFGWTARPGREGERT